VQNLLEDIQRHNLRGMIDEQTRGWTDLTKYWFTTSRSTRSKTSRRN